MTVAEGGSLFDPETFSSGGFLDNVNVTFTAARVITQKDTPFDPQPDDSCFLHLSMRQDGADDDSEVSHEYYRLGGIDKFTPSSDNGRVVVQAGATVNKNSKAGLLITSLIKAGFPKKDLPTDNSVAFFVGLHCHVNRVEMAGTFKDDDSFKRKEGAKKRDEKPKVLIITELLEPLGAGKGKTAGAPKSSTAAKSTSAASPSSAAAATAGTDVATVTENALVKLLIEKGSLQKRLLPSTILKVIEDKAVSVPAFKLIGDNAWLGDAARPWAFDAGSTELSVSDLTAERFATL